MVHGVTTAPIIEDKGKVIIPPGRPPRPYDNKVQSLGAREPRQAWGEGNQSDELEMPLLLLHFIFLFFLLLFIFIYSEGGFLSLREDLTGTHTQNNAFSPMLGSRVLSYADDDTIIEKNIYDLPDYSEPTSSPPPQVNKLDKE